MSLELSVVSLWAVDFVLLVLLAVYNGRLILHHGGIPFPKPVFIGTALCITCIVYGLFLDPLSVDVILHLIPAAATAAGLLVLWLISIYQWRKALRKDTDAPILENDAPVDNASNATPRMRILVTRLSKLLRNANTSVPLTIAITGQWGGGKSSLMRMIQRDVGKDDCPCVWFNAWHHQREAHIFAALMEAVYSAIQQWSSAKYIRFRLALLSIRSQQAPWRFRLFVVSLVLLAEGVRQIGVALAAGSTLGGMGPMFVLLAAHPAVTGYKSFLKIFGVTPAHLQSQWTGWFKLARFTDRLSFRHKFGTAFKEVCQALGDRRLVIVIDDLDRCKPEHIVAILEAVNFITSSGDCVVLLGIDENHVRRAIGLYYSDIATCGTDDAAKERARLEYADRYLEKLISLRVPVPAVSGKELLDIRGR